MNNPSSYFRLRQEDISRLINDKTLAVQAWNELHNIAQSGIGLMKRNVASNVPMQAKLNDLEQRYGHGLLTVVVRDFENDPFGWGQINIFKQSFAQLFMSYFELRKLNLLRRMDRAEGRQPTVEPLSDEEFKTKYGEPPWIFVNKILAEARLDFEIDYPIEHSTTKFTPQLQKTTSGIELKFSELSSGERILMSFAFCLYYSLDTRQDYQRPKLLLFDEIDAPLHPSMSRQLIETIQKSLVEELGVNVILATHAPATVAVMPEETIYVMRPDEQGLQKVGKRQAIAVLTAEIPTLSIDYSGRRQVFVESRYDAERYEKLYRYLSPQIDSERSLAFVAVGNKKKDSDENSGCDQVKRIVYELVKSGNESVFGLVDWDLKNLSDNRITVLAQNKRYAIENCLLDPLLVGVLATLTNRVWSHQIGLPLDKGYSDFRKFTGNECQMIIDGVERKVLGLSDDAEFGERTPVQYVGGISAQVSTRLLKMPGHELEALFKKKLPILRVYQNQGELLMKLIDPVVFELIKLTPVEIAEAFRTILECEVGISDQEN